MRRRWSKRATHPRRADSPTCSRCLRTRPTTATWCAPRPAGGRAIKTRRASMPNLPGPSSGGTTRYDVYFHQLSVATSFIQAALERDIQATLAEWQPLLRDADLIFVHAPAVNGNAVFAGPGAPLRLSDPRVRRIPFVVRRPTFSEVKRVVHQLLQVRHKG